MNNVRGLALDEREDEMRLYVAVQRIGVVVLRVHLSDDGSIELEEETILDDVTEPLSLHLRIDAGTGERLLHVCDHRQGLRVYSSNPR